MRYPRDPSLDPQLVWKGKDEQDGHDLEVPAVPIYIQETIDPLALIEELRAESEGRRTEQQLGFFGAVHRPDVRGEGRLLPPRRQVVEPDDPRRLAAGDDEPRREGGPQGPGPDHLHRPAVRDQVRLATGRSRTRKRDVRDGKDTDLTRQPEQVRAYRDTWELGIHSYLSYLRDRLVVRARAPHRVGVGLRPDRRRERCISSGALLDEVFGADNFVSLIAFARRRAEFESRRARERRRLHPLVRTRSRSRQVPAACSSRPRIVGDRIRLGAVAGWRRRGR